MNTPTHIAAACPFCGSTTATVECDQPLMVYVMCGDCMAVCGCHGDEQEAIAAWNRRVPAVSARWIAVSERLPEVVIDEKGDTNSVLALWKPGKLASNLCNPMTSNTAYFCKNADSFSHWMHLPLPPTAVKKMPAPRPFADVARDVAAARASLPAPDEWLKGAQRLVGRYGHAVALGSAALDEERELLAHLDARHGADTERPVSNEKETLRDRVITAAKAVSYSNGFDAALPEKQAELYAALKALEKP